MEPASSQSDVKSLKALLAQSRVDRRSLTELPLKVVRDDAQRDFNRVDSSVDSRAVKCRASLLVTHGSLNSSSEQTLMAAVRAVTSKLPAKVQSHLHTLARVEPTTPKHAQNAEAALKTYFEAPEKQAADWYKRVDEKRCRHIVAQNSLSALRLSDCRSCLSPGQHAAYRPLVQYFTQTGRTDYVKAVLAHQWPCVDQEQFARLACEANGAFTLFPDTSVVIDLMRAERLTYLQRVKRTYLTRQGVPDGDSGDEAVSVFAAVEGEETDGQPCAEVDVSGADIHRNPNYLQLPHVRGMALRRRRANTEARLIHFLREASEHREVLESLCNASLAPTTDLAPDLEHVIDAELKGQEDALHAAPRQEPQPEEEEAFDFFEDEPAADNDVPKTTSTPVVTCAELRTRKPHKSHRHPSTHIQSDVYTVVWGMDTHQFTGRYVERKVPSVTVESTITHLPGVDTESTTPLSTSVKSHKKPSTAAAVSTMPPPAHVLTQLPPMSTLDDIDVFLSCGAECTESTLARMTRAAEVYPPQWFNPRMERDTLATPPAPPQAMSRTASAQSVVNDDKNAENSTDANRPALSAQMIAARVSDMAFTIDATALEALLKVALPPRTGKNHTVQLPVRVQALPAAGSGVTEGDASPRVRLHVFLGSPFPSKTETRREITTAALTALLDSAVAQSPASPCTLPRTSSRAVGLMDDGSELDTTAGPLRTPITVVPTSSPEAPTPASTTDASVAVADVTLHRATDTITATTTTSSPASPLPPQRIPLRVLHPLPWRLVGADAGPEKEEKTSTRPVFRLVKAEYLNAECIVANACPTPPEPSTRGESVPTPIFVEAMSIEEAFSLTSLFSCFPEALVAVCRVNAYTGAVLGVDTWSCTRWRQFLTRQRELERVRMRHSVRAPNTTIASRPKRPREDEVRQGGDHEHADEDGTSARSRKALDELASAPSPSVLSAENLTVLDHSWDCLFDILDRLSLEVSALCAQQLALCDPPLAATTEEAVQTPLLTFDFVLANVHAPLAKHTAATPKGASGARRGRDAKLKGGPPLFKVTLKSPDNVFHAYTLPITSEAVMSQGDFIQPASLEACHEQYLPAANWPYSDRIPFSFQP